MADTDKIKAGMTGDVAVRVPKWVAAALLAAALGFAGGLAAWLQNSATKQEVMIEKQEAGVQATNELKAEVKELRKELGDDNAKLRAELNTLRERVAALEARVK